MTECSDATVLVGGRAQASTHSYFTWSWPGLTLILNMRFSCPTLDVVLRAYAKGGWVKTPLELDIFQKLYYLLKGDCFRILFACLFVGLMQIPRNVFACKFQGTL